MRIEIPLFFLALIVAEPTWARAASSAKIANCSEVASVKAGEGRAFRGSIKNSDYSFVAKIPKGFTGWDGADRDAPFHGFVIFFDRNMTACINFEIHIRVDQADAPKLPPDGKSIKLGAASAWRIMRRGKIGKERVTNVSTMFSFENLGQISDGEIILISPTDNLDHLRTYYDDFLYSLKFYKK